MLITSGGEVVEQVRLLYDLNKACHIRVQVEVEVVTKFQVTSSS